MKAARQVHVKSSRAFHTHCNTENHSPGGAILTALAVKLYSRFDFCTSHENRLPRLPRRAKRLAASWDIGTAKFYDPKFSDSIGRASRYCRLHL